MTVDLGRANIDGRVEVASIDLDTLLRHHREGLDRIAHVIDGAADYDAIVGAKVPASLRIAFSAATPLAEKVDRAVAETASALSSKVVKAVSGIGSGIYFFGSSANNLREFEFFSRFFPEADYKSKNISDFPREKIHLSPEIHEAMLSSLVRDVRDFYDERKVIDHCMVHQQLMYTRSYLSFACSLQASSEMPSLLVVANDHMPVHVAISMAMKSVGVPRLYLQHAEVSESFPPLDFEFSVLRSEGSLRTYQNVSPINGRTFVIPRSDEPFEAAKLEERRGNDVTVVVYPTARVRLDEMRECLANLTGNPDVRQVLIKPHPNSMPKLERSLPPGDYEFISAPLPHDHIAVVGNSSIALELLYRGVPVYQNFDFDPVAPDYYGLVADGLTLHTSMAELKDTFWRPYELTPSWLNAFRLRRPIADESTRAQSEEFKAAIRQVIGDPLVTANRSVLPQVRFPKPRTIVSKSAKWFAKGAVRSVVNVSPNIAARAFRYGLNISELKQRSNQAADGAPSSVRAPAARSKGKVRNPKTLAPGDIESRMAMIRISVVHSIDPAQWLAACEQTGVFSEREIIQALEAMFQERDPAFQKVLKGDYSEGSGAVSVWAQIRKLDWTLQLPSKAHLDSLARFIYEYSGDSVVRSWLESALLSVLLRHGDIDQIHEYFRSAVRSKLENLFINRQIALLRRLSSFEGFEQDVASFRRIFERNASSFHRLKFKNMDALEGRAATGWRHEQAVANFIETAPGALAAEFRDILAPTYQALRARKWCIDVRNEPSQARHVQQLIVEALTDRRPLSLIRLSDGEGYLFPEGKFFDRDDRANRERHWWGSELSLEMRTKIIEQARDALREADIVGIPSVYRFIRDHSDRSTSLASAIQGRGLLDVLLGVEACTRADSVITEDKVNVSLFGSVREVAALSSAAQRTVLVSSVKPERLPAMLTNNVDLVTIVVPTHHRTSTNDDYHGGAASLPHVYEELLKEVEDVSAPGALVLVGAGIIGKIFIGCARANGAVALDIGSVVDDWIAGSVSSLR